uniref:RxLR effector candidate protein n=1 Tax=Hyaloperonospora arabidopsidis (strain Emoy2) TaxID=559515 RepID=M4BZX5_HYAAE|nr:RxLR effector candidate protein [Hyaloperonospora arabidopsidis Emoy2]
MYSTPFTCVARTTRSFHRSFRNSPGSPNISDIRPLPPIIRTFVILQWTSAGSTTTTGHRTEFAARNVSAVSPSPETTVSVESSRSQTQGLVTGKVSIEHGDQEEKTGWSELLDARVVLGVEEILSSFPLDLHRGSSEIKTINKQTRMLVTHERLEMWLHDFQTPGHSVRDDDRIQALVHSGKAGKLAKLFLRLRGIDELKGRVEAMQRALLDEYPEALSKVSKVWLRSALNPEVAWSMLPVPVKQQFWDATSSKSEWPAALDMIVHWLNYVNEYRALPQMLGDGQVIEVLAGNRPTKEVEEMFHQLEIVADTKRLTDRMQKSLKRRHQLKEMLGIGLGPQQVFDTMDVPLKTNFQGPRKNMWPNVLSLLEDWLDYVDKYQSPARKFSDYQVIKVLTKHREYEEVMEMCTKLQDVLGMEARAKKIFNVAVLQHKFDQWLEKGSSPAKKFYLPDADRTGIGQVDPGFRELALACRLV